MLETQNMRCQHVVRRCHAMSTQLAYISFENIASAIDVCCMYEDRWRKNEHLCAPVVLLLGTTAIGKIDESYTQRIETDKILFRPTIV